MRSDLTRNIMREAKAKMEKICMRCETVPVRILYLWWVERRRDNIDSLPRKATQTTVESLSQSI
jgi:hypothetical protein